MARKEKRLEAMRRNPDGWTIENVGSLCRSFGIDFAKPSGGSHYGIAHPSQEHHLTVPRDRPIKRIYIKRLVEFVDAVLAAEDGDEPEEVSDAR